VFPVHINLFIVLELEIYIVVDLSRFKKTSRPFLKGGSFLLIALCIFSLALLIKQTGKIYKTYCIEKSSYCPIEPRKITEEKKFVVIITAYNNEDYVAKALSSVFEQDYQNYRVICIDDCSIDATYEKALERINLSAQKDKITLIKNPKNQKPLYNIYYAVQSCKDDEIVVLLNGNDWLASPYVLFELNRYYNDEEVWMTYGQLITYPDYRRGEARSPFFGALKWGKVRSSGIFSNSEEEIFSHLRTFYAGLFKHIKMEDLLYEGAFYPYSWQMAVMFPMLEMARAHAVFIPEVLYVYNLETPRDNKNTEKAKATYANYIRSLSPYLSLSTHPKLGLLKLENSRSDLFVFSENRPLQLYSFLESLKMHAQGFDDIYVYYEANDEKFNAGYELVRKSFPNCIFQKNNPNQPDSFCQFFAKMLKSQTNNYITFAYDQVIIKDDLDVEKATMLLEKTGAYGFFFHLGLNVESFPNQVVSVGQRSFLWQFSHGTGDWKKSNNFQMTLYRKKDVKNYTNYIPFNSSDDFCRKWTRGFDVKRLGICYKNSRALEIPMQIIKVDSNEKIALYSREELNDRLLEGYKIDISALFQMKNKTTQIEFYPLFIPR